MASQARHGFSLLSRSLNYSLFGIFAFLPDCWNLPESGAQVFISLSSLRAHSPVATQRDAQRDWPQTCCVLSSPSLTQPFLTSPFVPSSSDPDQRQRPRVTLKEVGAHRGSALPSVTLAELWVPSRALALPLLFPLRLPGVPDGLGRICRVSVSPQPPPLLHTFRKSTDYFVPGEGEALPRVFLLNDISDSRVGGEGSHQSPAAAPQPQSRPAGASQLTVAGHTCPPH